MQRKPACWPKATSPPSRSTCSAAAPSIVMSAVARPKVSSTVPATTSPKSQETSAPVGSWTSDIASTLRALATGSISTGASPTHDTRTLTGERLAPLGIATRTGGSSWPNGSLGGDGDITPPVCTAAMTVAACHPPSSKRAPSQPWGWRRPSNDSIGRQATSPGTGTDSQAVPGVARQVSSVTSHSPSSSASRTKLPPPSE